MDRKLVISIFSYTQSTFSRLVWLNGKESMQDLWSGGPDVIKFTDAWLINPLPDYKILDFSIPKQIAENISKVHLKWKISTI